MVLTGRCLAIARGGLLTLLALMLVAFAAHPAAARAQAGPIDTARIDAYVAEQVRRHGLPGVALGIVEGDRIVHLNGFGKADQTGRPVTPQTPFVIASISKPLTATAVMQLVEAGQVELDAPVQRYLPDFRMADEAASARITVRHLLLHTSGIPVTSCDTREDAETLAQYVAELRTVALAAEPGARHDYCSGNYNVLGRIVEVVSGQSFGEYMQQQVFAPLAMRHSYTAEAEARRDGLAQGYWWLFGLAVPYHDRYNTSQLPSGYLIASAEDLTHFLIAQLNGGQYGGSSVLSPAGIAAMQAPGVPLGARAGTNGLGWQSSPIGGVPLIHHSGDHADVHGRAFIEPESRRGAVLLMNTNGLLALEGPLKEIEAGVARLLVGQEPAPVSSMSLGRRYLIVDAVLAALFALALWPLLRLPRWSAALRRRRSEGRARLPLVGLRLAAELGLPLVALGGMRLVLHGMGAQSWAEGLSIFPDLGAWLWTVSLLVLLTGAARLALTIRVVRGDDVARAPAAAALPAGEAGR
jgi:CubicO group peptidase (beta-lactamase class C family)